MQAGNKGSVGQMRLEKQNPSEVHVSTLKSEID
jgi:hypothetical protein